MIVLPLSPTENKRFSMVIFRSTTIPKFNFLFNNVKYLKKFIYFCGVKQITYSIK